MKRLTSLLFAACLSACSSLQQPAVVKDALLPTHPVYGQDSLALALPAFSEAGLAKETGQGGAYSQLDTTFGMGVKAATAILTSNHPKYFEVKIINGSCHSDGNCGSYEYAPKMNMAAICNLAGIKDAKFKTFYQYRVAVFHKLSNGFTGTIFIVSPINEHGCSTQEYATLADWTREIWPSVQLANSPLGGVHVEAYDGAWIERHGNKNLSGADIVSLDGVDATQIDFQTLLKDTVKTKITFVWDTSYNCRINQWIDPRKRSVCPTNQMFQVFAHIADPLPPIPSFTGKSCKSIKPFLAPDIWKPIAEYAPGDTRYPRPVLITKKLTPKGLVRVLASNGGVVGYLGYYDTYLDQGWRWYSGYKGGDSLSGYQFQHSAVQATGSPWVWLQDSKGNCIGSLPPGQRFGKFD